MLKIISCLILWPVLNSIITISSIVFWFGCNSNLFADGFDILCKTSDIVIRTVEPNGIVLGKEGLHSREVLSHIKSTEITEQSFKPALLSTNKSKQTTCVSEQKEQFSDFNNLGLARFGQMAFNTETTTPQNSQVATEIPTQYIFYKWAFFITAILEIIITIVWLIVLLCQVYNSLIIIYTKC